MNTASNKPAAPPPEWQRQLDAARARLLHNDAKTALAHAMVLTQRGPQYAPGWQLAGVAALQTGDLRLALEALQKAAALAPEDFECHNNLAAAWIRAGRYAEAAQAAQRAHQLMPSKPGPLLNWSNALQALGRLDEAVSAAEQALAQEREHPQAWNNLGNLYKEQGRADDALAAYETALELAPELREAFSNKLAAMKLLPEIAPKDLLAAHRAFAQRYECPVLASYQPSARDLNPERRLRIGYVSPDCHSAVPAFFRPVLRHHDPERFEIYCYYNNPQRLSDTSPWAQRIQSRVMLGHSDEAVAQQVRADAIDILVDIAGHTGKNRLGVFMHKPAPIQMTWLDYLGTTGLQCLDYRITDAIADPTPWAEEAHRETLLRLPQPQWCWEAPQDAPPVAPLPAAEGAPFTFGSFNNYSKLTDATLGLWSRLLAACPDSRLLVIGAAAGAAQERVRKALGVRAERVAFVPRVGARAYRELFAQVDLALDPLPFSGATTTLDALWQGVPVLTLPGRTSASRSSVSLLTALDLAEFVAEDEARYLALAQAWSQDRDRLAALREVLRERLRHSPIMDGARFTRALETLYREAWRAYCEPENAVNRGGAAVSGWRVSERQFEQALAKLQSGREEEAIADLDAVLAHRQNWRLAQQVYTSAVLAWAKRHPECLAPAPTPAIEESARETISVIVCSVDDAKQSAVAAGYRERFAGWPLELVVLTDARSLAEAYNRGAAMATGDILVFSHDDIALLTPDFAPRLQAHLAAYDGIGVCGAKQLVGPHWEQAGRPHLQGQILHRRPAEAGLLLLAAGCAQPVMEGVQGLDGVFIAVRRRVWETVRFDEDTFDGFHLYDLDFSFRAALAGFNLAVPLDLLLRHDSLGRYDAAWRVYAQRFERKFAQRLAPPPAVCAGSIGVRLNSVDEARLVLAGLRHFGFGHQ